MKKLSRASTSGDFFVREFCDIEYHFWYFSSIVVTLATMSALELSCSVPVKID